MFPSFLLKSQCFQNLCLAVCLIAGDAYLTARPNPRPNFCPYSSPTASGKRGASNFVHKLIEVDRLGAYWNSQSDLREKQRRRARGAALPEPEPPLEEYAYLMRPVDVKIKLAVRVPLRKFLWIGVVVRSTSFWFWPESFYFWTKVR